MNQRARKKQNTNLELSTVFLAKNHKIIQRKIKKTINRIVHPIEVLKQIQDNILLLEEDLRLNILKLQSLRNWSKIIFMILRNNSLINSKSSILRRTLLQKYRLSIQQPILWILLKNLINSIWDQDNILKNCKRYNRL